MYPARFYVTYPLMFIGGLAAMYALRSEVDLGGSGKLAVGVVGAFGFAAGWSIARDHQTQSTDEKRTPRFTPIMMVPLALPIVFVVKATVGSEVALWFCALAFVCLTVGFLFGACLTSGRLRRSGVGPSGIEKHRRSPRPSVRGMTNIEAIIVEATDPVAAEKFYTEAFDLGDRVRVRPSEEPTSGFRGFTLSLIVDQPADVHALVESALAAGATELKPVKKSLWGVGGVVQAPDGTIWKVATSAKKDTGPATRRVDKLVLLIGAEDVAASRHFYVDRGLRVAKSFGRKYVEFDTGSAPVGFGLYGRKALAKDAGVAPDGTGSHRLVIVTNGESDTDPDGFSWQNGAS